MYQVKDFIKWALRHIDPNTIPKSAHLPVSFEECGAEPWHYLFGSTRVQTTKAMLDYYYKNHYCKQMTREKYDSITADWKPTDYATDCQGLCDAYLTYECGEKTDTNADGNYKNWCEDKGSIAIIKRDYVIGEAVFMMNSSTGRMTHIGWVCGFDADGDPLIVEARGIEYGVVVTSFKSRRWTNRGIMSKKFDYTGGKGMRFEVTKPMQRGLMFKKMQDALDEAGYTDADGNRLEVDGIWGNKSQQAFDRLIADYAVKPPEVLDAFDGKNGKYRLVLEYK